MEIKLEIQKYLRNHHYLPFYDQGNNFLFQTTDSYLRRKGREGYSPVQGVRYISQAVTHINVYNVWLGDIVRIYSLNLPSKTIL